MIDFEDHGLSAGVWSGVLRRNIAPARIVLMHLGSVIDEAELVESAPGEWRLSVSVPSEHFSDGVHSFLLVADSNPAGASDLSPGAAAQVISRLSMVAGAPLDHEIQAEMELLRAEIDMLKREFRRLATQG